MNEEKMLACPFCGTLPKYGEKECHGSGKPMNAWWVMCPYCQATGPTRGNSIEAMLEWNKRVGVRQPATPEVEDVKALASAHCSAAPNWYKSHDMYVLLMSAPIRFRTRNEAFNFKPNDDFCVWLSGHLNLAFQKGWDMAKREQPNAPN